MTGAPAPSPSLRIGIVAHLAYGALSGSAGHIGGVERQTTLMARWLAARGHDVTMLTWDEGQRDGASIDGVRVMKMCGQGDGVPVVRFVHPRWTSLYAALKRADADVYYQNCGEYVTGQVALWCRLHRRAFVYSAASDADCDPRLPLMSERRDRAFYRLGLRLANRIIVQTLTQQQMMEDGFGYESTVIPMPCPQPDRRMPATPAFETRRTILWVGRIVEVKRLDRLIELARLCPELRFLVIGPRSETDPHVREFVPIAQTVPNITLCGPAGREQLEDLYRTAGVLCCTSEHEGFPNVFLEAWSHGLPVVSTWDPDAVIARHGLGAVAADVPALAAAIRALLASEAQWTHASAKAQHYFEQNHEVGRVMPRFERVLADAAARSPRAGLRPRVAQGAAS